MRRIPTEMTDFSDFDGCLHKRLQKHFHHQYELLPVVWDVVLTYLEIQSDFPELLWSHAGRWYCALRTYCNFLAQSSLRLGADLKKCLYFLQHQTLALSYTLSLQCDLELSHISHQKEFVFGGVVIQRQRLFYQSQFCNKNHSQQMMISFSSSVEKFALWLLDLKVSDSIRHQAMRLQEYAQTFLGLTMFNEGIINSNEQIG